MVRKLGGIGNPLLYEHASIVGTKKLIEEYTQEVVNQLRYVCDYEDTDGQLTLEKKFDFFYQSRQSYGRSALLLSGGATMGMHIFGGIIYCSPEIQACITSE